MGLCTRPEPHGHSGSDRHDGGVLVQGTDTLVEGSISEAGEVIVDGGTIEGKLKC